MRDIGQQGVWIRWSTLMSLATWTSFKKKDGGRKPPRYVDNTEGANWESPWSSCPGRWVAQSVTSKGESNQSTFEAALGYRQACLEALFSKNESEVQACVVQFRIKQEPKYLRVTKSKDQNWAWKLSYGRKLGRSDQEEVLSSVATTVCIRVCCGWTN